MTEVPVIEVINGGLVKKSDRKSVDPFDFSAFGDPTNSRCTAKLSAMV